MNRLARRVARVKEHLSTRDRLALFVDALGADDDVEVNRLLTSAPRAIKALPDFLLPAIALQTLTQLYVTQQLSQIAHYWHAQWRLEIKDEDVSLWSLDRDVSAYLIAANFRAWRDFCSGLCVDPNTLVAGNQADSGWILEFCEERMPSFAPVACELVERLQQHRPQKVVQIVTAEILLTKWQSLWHELTSRSLRDGE